MPTSSLTVPATLESLSEIAAFVQSAADDAGLEPNARYRLRLAVDESATNVVMHGSCAGPIEVRSECDDQALTVVHEAAGEPFDPREAPPPRTLHLPAEERPVGGLGIYLSLSNIDRFE